MGGSTPFPATPFPRPVGSHPDHGAVEIAAIEGSDGGPGFMPLHIDDGKALAITGKEIFCHFERTDYAVFRKERSQALFCGRSGETTDRKGNQ